MIVAPSYAELFIHGAVASDEDEIVDGLASCFVSHDAGTPAARPAPPGTPPEDLLSSFKDACGTSKLITRGARELIDDTTTLEEAFECCLRDKGVRTHLRNQYQIDPGRILDQTRSSLPLFPPGERSAEITLDEESCRDVSPVEKAHVQPGSESLHSVCSSFPILESTAATIHSESASGWTSTSASDLVTALGRDDDARLTLQILESSLQHDPEFVVVLWAAAIAGTIHVHSAHLATLRVMAVRAMLACNAAESALAEAYRLRQDRSLLGLLPDGERRRLEDLTARALLRMGQLDEAHTVLGGVLAREPTSLDALIALLSAQAVSSAHDPRLLADAAFARFPEASPRQQLVIADALSSVGDHGRSMAAHQLHLQLETSLPEAHLGLANAALAMGQLELQQASIARFLASSGLAMDASRPAAAFPFRFDSVDILPRHDGPLVTVIMAAHDAEETVEQAVRSVLRQTHARIQLVVVDDYSSDATHEILHALAAEDPRLWLARLSRRAGPYTARNVGIVAALGDYITFHDSDDWMHPRRLEEHLLLSAHHGYAVTTSDWIRVRADGNVATTTPGTFVHTNPMSMFLEKRAIENAGFFHGLAAAADSEMIHRLRANVGPRRHHHISKCLAIGLDRPTSLTRSGSTALPPHRASPARTHYAETWLRAHLQRRAQGDTIVTPNVSPGATFSTSGGATSTVFPVSEDLQPSYPEPAPPPEQPAEARFLAAQHQFSGHAFATARIFVADAERQVVDLTTTTRVGNPPPDATLGTVIVVSHVPGQDVGTALEHIAAQVANHPLDVVLVDNGNHELAALGARLLPSFLDVRPPFNVGCSMGRNLGAAHASGEYLIFLDDDGFIAPGCIEALLRAAQETDACAVRGCVRPKTADNLGANHYDLGPVRRPEVINTEGVSIWKRQAFLDASGFDPLLSGHEGLLLGAQLWRFHGPLGFLYEPNAILHHDYASSPDLVAKKHIKHANNETYVRWLDPNAHRIRHRQRAASGDFPAITAALLAAAPRRKNPSTLKPTILTTAYNGAAFIREFVTCWKSQTHQDFSLVFVDDGSTDNTANLLERAWGDDSRLRLVSTERQGRSAALNLALETADGPVCLIADVDDISRPDRIARTLEYFDRNPEATAMGFPVYDEEHTFRLGRPRSPSVTDLGVRQLFGTPAPFPSFAFRPSHFPLPFDESLPAGVDYDWIVRNSLESPIRGDIIYFPMVYYRLHGNQISASHRETQQAARAHGIHASFRVVLGPLSEHDCAMINALVLKQSPGRVRRETLGAWLHEFSLRNLEHEFYDPEALAIAFYEALIDAGTI